MKELAFFIIVIALSEAVAQYSVKKYTLNKNFLYFIVAILGYTSVCYLLSLSYKHSTIGVTNALWSATSVVTILTLGYFAFGESLKKLEMIGIMFVILGVGLINFNNITF